MTRARFLLVFGLVLALRVAVAARFRGNFDTQSFLIAVQAVSEGQNLYAATDRYHASPLWAWLLAGVWKVSPSVGAFVLMLGLFQTMADAASAFLLSGIGRRRLALDPGEARRRGLLFFSNPISVLISCAHGQFDGLSILCLLAALLVSAGASTRARQIGTAALLALSLAVKHVTVFHPLLFSRRRERGGLRDGLVIAVYAAFAASFLPYAAAFGPIFRNALAYGWGSRSGAPPEPGALQAFFDFPRGAAPAYALVLLAGMAWVLRELRRVELTRACLILFLALLSLSPSSAAQFLVWPVALGSLFPSAGYGAFSFVGAVALSAAPDGLAIPWPVRVTPLGTYVATLLWFGAEILRIRRESASPDRASGG